MSQVHRYRFDGAIAGVGTASGIRLVAGIWPRSPFGPVADVMIEAGDGHRLLVAARADLARFVAATYAFDEIRVEPLRLHRDGPCWALEGASLRLAVTVGARTGTGRLLCLVPRTVARQRWWCRAVDPVARRVRPGVRTLGTAGGGRREWYGAHDEHAISDVHAVLDGDDLGRLAPVHPPVRFGFGSAPRRPALVRVTTTVEEAR